MNTEKAVLNYFIQNLGNYTSGEELSNKLNISRTAVWKAVKQLKEQGYEFVTTPKMFELKGVDKKAHTGILWTEVK